MNKTTLQAGWKFILENKGIQKMFKDMEKTHKQVEAALKKAEQLKNGK